MPKMNAIAHYCDPCKTEHMVGQHLFTPYMLDHYDIYRAASFYNRGVWSLEFTAKWLGVSEDVMRKLAYSYRPGEWIK